MNAWNSYLHSPIRVHGNGYGFRAWYLVKIRDTFTFIWVFTSFLFCHLSHVPKFRHVFLQFVSSFVTKYFYASLTLYEQPHCTLRSNILFSIYLWIWTQQPSPCTEGMLGTPRLDSSYSVTINKSTEEDKNSWTGNTIAAEWNKEHSYVNTVGEGTEGLICRDDFCRSWSLRTHRTSGSG
jgi:hypothetical protein